MKQPYLHDVIQVVKLGEHYQIKYLQSVKEPGFEYSLLGSNTKGKNNKKLKNNISRALTTCRNIALSNEWDYFITLTLDPKKYDRFNIKQFKVDLSKFFKSLNRKYNCHVNYLLVPEQHKNGAWHMHGLISGVPADLITVNVFGFYDFRPYSTHFGYCSLSPVKSSVAISFYISKHLGKQLYNGIISINDHLYICSRGLSRGELIKVIPAIDFPLDFNWQYVSEDKSYKSSFFEDDTFLKFNNVL